MVDPESENNLFKKISEMDGIPEYGQVRIGVIFSGLCWHLYQQSNGSGFCDSSGKAGVDYTVLSGLEYCCGAVSAGAGDQDPICKHGQKNIDEIRKRGAIVLSLPAPGVSKLLKIFIHACLEDWTLKFCRSLSTLTGF